MNAEIQSSMAAQSKEANALIPAALAMIWVLLFLASPLAGQQDQIQVTTTGIGDDPMSAVMESYSGPAVLSRGYQPAVTAGLADTIQPFVSVNGIYGTGAGGSYDNTGAGLPAGVELGFGLKGTHRWRKMTLQFDYNGSYRDYTGQAVGSGLNQFLVVSAFSQIARHVLLSFRQTGGILKQDIGGLLLQPAFLESSSTAPTNEPFSNGLNLIDSVVTLTYQKSRRLSMSASIEGSLVHQDSMLLVGTTSGIGRADLEYRLSNRATIGVDYSFSHFGYTTFGSADVQCAAVDYTWRATKSVDLAFQVGLAHSTTEGLAIVPIDPAIATLLGAATGTQVSYRTSNTPMLNVRITKRWRGVSADFNYINGVSPGNGLVQTSAQESITSGLQYTIANRWTMSLQAGRTTMAQLAGVGSYTGTIFGASFSRLIRPGLQTVARFSIVPVSATALQGLTHTYYRAEIGFVFTPNQIPIALR